MTEPDPTAAADQAFPATDAVPDGSTPDDRADFQEWDPIGTAPAAPISGVDIREIDTSDLIEAEQLLGRSVPTRPTAVGPASPQPSPPPDDPLAAFYTAKWESDEQTGDRRYRGRRRVKVAEPRFWAATVAAIVVIGGLLYWVLSLAPLSGAGSPAPTGSADLSLPGIAVGPSSLASLIPSVTPTASPAPPTAPPSTAPPPFAPMTIEAESGTVGGSAEVDRNNRASKKHIVQQLGNWGSGAPGTLTIVTGTVPTAGTYAMTISYLHTNSEPTRSAVITVNSVALPATTFTATNGMCCFTLTIKLTLRAGRNTIVFANPTGHGPGLDKIVITRPG